VYHGFINGFNRVEGRFYPKHGSITNMGPGLEFDRTLLLNGTITDKLSLRIIPLTIKILVDCSEQWQRIFSLLPQDFNPLIQK